jgi:hydrogenase maturation protease
MLTIIGCGNPNRSDDGAGVVVVQRLLAELADEPAQAVRIFDAGTNGMEVMFKARGSSELVLVDASTSDAEAGSICELPGERLENVPDPGHGSHGFRWDHALYAGKRIYGREFPERVTVYLIESQSLELGVGLSAPVERAVKQVVELLLDRVKIAMKPWIESVPVRLQNGSLYLDAEVYEAFFGTRDSVAVLSRDEQIAVFPLSPGGVGGSFAKIMNARGDRVIHARELLRGLDLDDSESHELVARWDAELSALVLPRPAPGAVCHSRSEGSR